MVPGFRQANTECDGFKDVYERANVTQTWSSGVCAHLKNYKNRIVHCNEELHDLKRYKIVTRKIRKKATN